MKITKGQIIVVTEGSYSDYDIKDYMRALRDFDTLEVAGRFNEAEKRAKEEWNGADLFMAWALREGLWEPLTAAEVVEWHIGGGCGFDPRR